MKYLTPEEFSARAGIGPVAVRTLCARGHGGRRGGRKRGAGMMCDCVLRAARADGAPWAEGSQAAACVGAPGRILETRDIGAERCMRVMFFPDGAGPLDFWVAPSEVEFLIYPWRIDE